VDDYRPPRNFSLGPKTQIGEIEGMFCPSRGTLWFLERRKRGGKESYQKKKKLGVRGTTHGEGGSGEKHQQYGAPDKWAKAEVMQGGGMPKTRGVRKATQHERKG